MCGIYCLYNEIEKKYYIGRSVNIEERIKSHIYESNNPNQKQYFYSISKSIRKYGIESFTLTILEECRPENLDEREIFYISMYKEKYSLYNMTDGGNTPPPKKGSTNGRAKLKEEDIIYIRTQLLNQVLISKVYEEFKDRISKRGFQHIWWGTSWLDIMPEIYADRKKLFSYTHRAAALASAEKRRDK